MIYSAKHQLTAVFRCVKSAYIRSFLIRIFSHLDLIQRFTGQIFVFNLNSGKYGSEKFRMWTLFTLCLTLMVHLPQHLIISFEVWNTTGETVYLIFENNLIHISIQSHRNEDIIVWKITQKQSFFQNSMQLTTKLWTALLEIIVLSKHKKVFYMFWKECWFRITFLRVSNLLELAEIQ